MQHELKRSLPTLPYRQFFRKPIVAYSKEKAEGFYQDIHNIKRPSMEDGTLTV